MQAYHGQRSVLFFSVKVSVIQRTHRNASIHSKWHRLVTTKGDPLRFIGTSQRQWSDPLHKRWSTEIHWYIAKAMKWSTPPRARWGWRVALECTSGDAWGFYHSCEQMTQAWNWFTLRSTIPGSIQAYHGQRSVLFCSVKVSVIQRTHRNASIHSKWHRLVTTKGDPLRFIGTSQRQWSDPLHHPQALKGSGVSPSTSQDTWQSPVKWLSCIFIKESGQPRSFHQQAARLSISVHWLSCSPTPSCLYCFKGVMLVNDIKGWTRMPDHMWCEQAGPYPKLFWKPSEEFFILMQAKWKNRSLWFSHAAVQKLKEIIAPRTMWWVRQNHIIRCASLSHWAKVCISKEHSIWGSKRLDSFDDITKLPT